MAQLLGPDGRPVTSKKVLAVEVARPGLTGVRQAFSTETMIAGLTPDRLDAILRQANTGDMDAFLTLSEEMEERDPHYGSVLQTRKLAVMGLERKLTWASGHEDHPKADEILTACEQLIAAPALDDLLENLLDAIAKGYAAPEIIWDTGGKMWRPVAYAWRDPRWFQFDRETGQELRLKTTGSMDGEQLPAFKFAVHLAGRKSGLPARGGLARLVAFSFVCKLYGMKDWMAFAEIFGIPLRLGQYDASASPEDVDVLKRAVFGLGSDAAAVIPASMKIDFPSPTNGAGGAELFAQLVTFIDGQVSKAVLGQTGTTDMQKGGGFAQSKVLDGVRGDLTKADAKGCAATITRAILAPFVAFNYGPDAPVPACELIVEEPEDMAALSDALEKLVPLGLKVRQSEVRKKLKLSEPDADDELLTPPAAGAPPTRPEDVEAEPEAPETPALARDGRGASAPAGGIEGARARRELVDADLDALTLAGLDGWQQTFGLEAASVISVVQAADSFEAVLTGLDGLANDLAVPLSARSLARAMFLAGATGAGAARTKA